MDKSLLINGFEQAHKRLTDALVSPAQNDLEKAASDPAKTRYLKVWGNRTSPSRSAASPAKHEISRPPIEDN